MTCFDGVLLTLELRQLTLGYYAHQHQHSICKHEEPYWDNWASLVGMFMIFPHVMHAQSFCVLQRGVVTWYG